MPKIMSFEEIRCFVQKLKRKHGTSDVIAITKGEGIEIQYHDTNNLEGFHVYMNRMHTIVVNKKLSYNRQLLVIAHELAHALLHKGINQNFMRTFTHLSTDRYEIEANFVAFEFCLNDDIDDHTTVDELISKYHLKKSEIQTMAEYVQGQESLWMKGYYE